jgi:mRNA-degrading endonuclease RelE of RelBE toxin-antitoxin system
MIDYEESEEFKKDFKKLIKRFISLSEDFVTVKKAVIELRHVSNIDNLSTFEISGFNSDKLTFWKIKKIACKSLKGRGVKSGLRIIYCWQPANKKIVFLEIYFKGDKENEDKNRIKHFLSSVID